MSVQVIVSGTHGKKDSICSCCGRTEDRECQSLEEAIRLAGYHLQYTQSTEQKVCIIIRPNHNEIDSSGEFFREWRSFNGKPFEEVRWNIGINAVDWMRDL